MGVEGLWKVVAPRMEQVDLTAFLIDHSPPNERGYYRLGVDVSVWLRQCCAPFQRAHAQAGQNPELRTFYYRLVELFVRPVAVVFVVDGPGRPTVKRGTRVIPKPHWLTAGAKDLVDAFGFEWMEAPGEAEAELASMNAMGVIDGVMSDDSDVLVFGARTVIRNLPKKKKKPRGKVDTLTENRMPSLGDLLLLAGLEGCGIQTALGLARYGLGASLLSRAWEAVYTGDSYQLPLDDWRRSLRDYLRHDPDGYVGQRNAVLAASVANNFPDVNVVMAHVRPLTTGGDCIPLDAEFGRSARFHVARIGQLCDRFFAWDLKKIADKMARSVWPGVVMRLLGAEKHKLDWAEHQISKDDCKLVLDSITHTKTRTRTNAGYAEYRVKVDISPIRDATFSLLPSSSSGVTPKSHTLTIWLPKSVLAEGRASKRHMSNKMCAHGGTSHPSAPTSSSLAPSSPPRFSPSMLEPSLSPSPPPPSALLTKYLLPSHVIDLTGDCGDEQDVIDLTLD